MNDFDSALLRIVADNQPLFDTLKATIRGQFAFDSIVPDVSNDILGQRVRARIDGLALVDEAFATIKRCATVPQGKGGQNPAR